MLQIVAMCMDCPPADGAAGSAATTARAAAATPWTSAPATYARTCARPPAASGDRQTTPTKRLCALCRRDNDLITCGSLFSLTIVNIRLLERLILVSAKSLLRYEYWLNRVQF
jgi:hypothetical protein